MTLPPSKPSPGAPGEPLQKRPRLDRRGWLGLLAFGALIVIALSVASAIVVNPIQPTTIQPSQTSPTNVWADSLQGSQESSVTGNGSGSSGTLLLGSALEGVTSTAGYSIGFPAASSLDGTRTELTVYVLGVADFESNTEPLVVTLDGHTFDTVLHNTTKVPWDANPVYVLDPADLTSIPSNVTGFGGGGYLAFSYTTTTPDDTQSISITVPAHGQIYVAQVLVVGFGPTFTPDPQTRETAELMLPVLAVGVVGLGYLFVRLRLGEHLPEVLVVTAAQLVVAPFFLHHDLTNILAYPLGFYDLQALGAGTWGYGPAWLILLDLPFALPFALGVVPDVALSILLLKLPAIIFGALTYLLLVRILTPRFGAMTSRWYAMGIWFVNPAILYFDALHGLLESVVAFWLLLFVYLLQRGRFWEAIASVTLGTLMVLPVLFAALAATAHRTWGSFRSVLLVILPSVVLAVAVLLVLAVSRIGINGQDFLAMLTHGTFSSESYGLATTSTMTPLIILQQRFDLTVTPILGLAVVLAAVVLAWLLGVRPSPRSYPLVIYASLLAFYLSYETFYVQHLVWVMPIFGLLLLVQSSRPVRAVMVTLGLAVLGLIVDYGQVWWPRGTPYLALGIFAALLLPLVLDLRTRPWVVENLPRALKVGWAVAVVAGLYAVGSSVTGGFGSSVVTGIGLPLLLVVLGLCRLMDLTGRLPRVLAPWVLLGGVLLPTLMLYLLSVTAPIAIQALYVLVMAVSLVEALRLLGRWLVPASGASEPSVPEVAA